MKIYYIGPESKVWHARSDCAALKGDWRYWPRREAVGREADRIIALRRPCKRCVPAGEENGR